LDADGIARYVDGMDQEVKKIRESNLRLAWYMRGGITYDQVMQLSYAERQMISDLAKDNIETTKKTRLPWF
jgi:hypothetical protein